MPTLRFSLSAVIHSVVGPTRVVVGPTCARIGALAVLALLVVPVSGFADDQATPTTDQRDVIQQLLTRINQLEQRLAEVEGKRSDQSPSVPPGSSGPNLTPTSSPAVTPDPPAEHEELPTGRPVLFGSPILQLRGFADVQYHVNNRAGDANGFALGQLDLFITSKLADTVSILSEMVVEADEANAIVLDLERVALQYTPNDFLHIAAGRYHTAIGYYNTAYHHGTWFQTHVGRPFLFAFEDEGGLLPVHDVGVSVTGRLPLLNRLGLHYTAELGNGRDYTSGHEAVTSAVAVGDGKAFNLAVTSRPEWLPGLQAGVSVYRDRPSPEGVAPITQHVIAMHVVYVKPTFEWLNEAVVIRHATGDRTMVIPGFYTQVARQFGVVRPYFRYEYVNAPENDPLPLFQNVGLRHGPSVGLRYNFSDFATLKAQFARVVQRGTASTNQLIVQAAFAF